jgi:methionyl-tRNA synthetase
MQVSMDSGHPVEWAQEVNYVFRLTSFRKQLLEWVSTEPYR